MDFSSSPVKVTEESFCVAKTKEKPHDLQEVSGHKSEPVKNQNEETRKTCFSPRKQTNRTSVVQIKCGCFKETSQSWHLGALDSFCGREMTGYIQEVEARRFKKNHLLQQK